MIGTTGPKALTDLRGQVVVLELRKPLPGAGRPALRVLTDLHGMKGVTAVSVVPWTGGDDPDVSALQQEWGVALPVVSVPRAHLPGKETTAIVAVLDPAGRIAYWHEGDERWPVVRMIAHALASQ